MQENKKFTNIVQNAVADRDPKKREMTFVISNEKPNRNGQVVKLDGWDLKNYKKNPILLVDHINSVAYTVGKAKRVWVDKKSGNLMGRYQFLDEGISPLADLAFALYDNDILNSVSPGYGTDMSKVEYDEKRDLRILNSNELYEVSLVGVPANPDAVKQNMMEQEYIKDAMELGVIDEDLIDKVIHSLKKSSDDKQEENVEQTIKEETDSVEQDFEDYLIDYFDLENQENSISDHEDEWAWFFNDSQALDDESADRDSEQDAQTDSNEGFDSYIAKNWLNDEDK